MAQRDFLDHLLRDLEPRVEVRRFGSGGLSGFFALLLAVVALGLVIGLYRLNLYLVVAAPHQFRG